MPSLLVQRLASANTRQQKSAARKMLNRYIEKRVIEGYDPVRVRGAVNASVTRLKRS